MADEEHPRTGPRALGHEMSGALERCAVDPARPEPERVELAAEHGADFPYAVEILSAAVDIDDALEQRERFLVVRVDVADERALVTREHG
jgi:hypothetical protein